MTDPVDIEALVLRAGVHIDDVNALLIEVQELREKVAANTEAAYEEARIEVRRLRSRFIAVDALLKDLENTSEFLAHNGDRADNSVSRAVSACTRRVRETMAMQA